MGYTESGDVRQARKKKQDQEQTRPGAYSSPWAQKQEQALGKLLDRKDFSYDLNADALYNQYKDAYIRQGKRAMEDAMGAAAARTGGYGSSYAQTAGQQAYQSYLQDLNSRIPDFYRQALEEYTRQGDELKERYQLAGQQEALDYSRYQDYLDQWLQERAYLADSYAGLRDQDYRRYQDSRDFAYQQQRDQEKDRQWREQMEYRWMTGKF